MFLVELAVGDCLIMTTDSDGVIKLKVVVAGETPIGQRFSGREYRLLGRLTFGYDIEPGFHPEPEKTVYSRIDPEVDPSPDLDPGLILAIADIGLIVWRVKSVELGNPKECQTMDDLTRQT